MSYWSGKGKYQKAYDFLYKKLVPATGASGTNLGEALRLVSRVVYRHYNDGDSYSDCIHEQMVPNFTNRKFPFNGKYGDLGDELSYLLDRDEYDEAVTLVLRHIMLSLSSDTGIYNPNSNRLAVINTPSGKKAFEALELSKVFINTCGKGEEWLSESLRREGVKIVKRLSPETLKELKCETLVEIHKPGGTKTKKVEFSQDRSVLSKKFDKLARQHKKSIRDEEKAQKLRIKRREESARKEHKLTVAEFKKTVAYYQELETLTGSKRSDVLKKLANDKKASFSHYTTKMLLLNLLVQKAKKPTTKTQRERKSELVARLVKEINNIGKLTIKMLNEHFTPSDEPQNAFHYGYGIKIRTDSLKLDRDYTEKLDKLLIEIMGSDEAVDALYTRCCKY